MDNPCGDWNTWRLRRGEWRKSQDTLIEEVTVKVVMGGSEIAGLMATPGWERELAAGFLITMGWARPQDPAPPAIWEPEKREVHLDMSVRSAPESGPRASGGGTLGPLSAPQAPDDFTLELDVVLGLTQAMAGGQVLFKKTGATHAAAFFDKKAALMVTAEDVGRHNAVDKAVGFLWLKGELAKARAAALSGRLSLEMVLKGARAGLGLMVSVSAPSAPAVRKAQELGITLAGFSRGGQVNIYTHPHRVTIDGQSLAQKAAEK